jgi:mycothiol system anti-sigma-R factor
MSADCGPGADDCLEVIQDVYLYLDGELAAESHTRIREHLDDCSPCLRKYGLEQDVKALVARCCGNDPAPDSLREKVLARLRVVRAEFGAQGLDPKA